jgi:hypothetical protein
MSLNLSSQIGLRLAQLATPIFAAILVCRLNNLRCLQRTATTGIIGTRRITINWDSWSIRIGGLTII